MESVFPFAMLVDPQVEAGKVTSEKPSVSQPEPAEKGDSGKTSRHIYANPRRLVMTGPFTPGSCYVFSANSGGQASHSGLSGGSFRTWSLR